MVDGRPARPGRGLLALALALPPSSKDLRLDGIYVVEGVRRRRPPPHRRSVYLLVFETLRADIDRSRVKRHAIKEGKLMMLP